MVYRVDLLVGVVAVEFDRDFAHLTVRLDRLYGTPEPVPRTERYTYHGPRPPEPP